jgi:hypothetical protein
MLASQSEITFGGACTGRRCYYSIMPHDPAHRPKRYRDPINAAFQAFQEVIGEAPRTVPTCTEEKGGGRAATSPAGQKKIRKAPKP